MHANKRESKKGLVWIANLFFRFVFIREIRG
jgi:hypothetical protein